MDETRSYLVSALRLLILAAESGDLAPPVADKINRLITGPQGLNACVAEQDYIISLMREAVKGDPA